MKSLSFFLSAACISIALQAPAAARTWTSADGKSTFDGELIEYKADTGEVTVDRGGEKITFKLDILSEKDIAFLKNEKRAPLSAAAPGNAQEIEFTPVPEANARRAWPIKTFGPVGIGIVLEKGFVMKIENVEEGSPAAKTGKFKKGQIIESINGVKLTDTKRDPRLVLAGLITQAEASDGKINIQLKDGGPVAVEIPVLGSYSPTWPLNCPKSDKIVRNLADLVAKNGENEWGSILFLLSTGEEKDLEVVRGWMKNKKPITAHNWSVGLQGMGLCEYYLRTGDASVLPLIKEGADHLRDTIYNGAWSGRKAAFTYQNGGHLNAAGVHCLTFLLLAQTCGVDVDEKTLQSSLAHFYAYSGKGSVPYGDFTPKPGYRDCNGKTAALGLAMAVASRLTPDGENSIYARSKQISAMKSYYGTNDYHMGHTGGGIGETWKSASMNLMAEKRPQQYRQYTDARQWIMDLSRRHTGGIGIGGGPESSYDQASGESQIAWGTFFALTYTAPRKHLHMFGAPLSKWAKSHTLPGRPSGSTAADDDFSSPYPVPGGPWSKEDIYKETLHQHAGGAVAKVLRDPKVSDETIKTYFHHPEVTHRFEAMNAMLRLEKYGMIPDLLGAEDARLRHVGIMALHELFGTWRKSSDKQKNSVTPGMLAEVEKIIRNPEESGFVKQWAVGLLQHYEVGELREFKDLLADLIENGPAQEAAVSASMALYTDPESYLTVFPPTIRAVSAATNYSMAVLQCGRISKALEQASPEIQAYGLKELKKVYQEQPGQLVSESGIYVIPSGAETKQKALAVALSFTEEGREFVKLLPKETLKSIVSGKDEDIYQYNGKFTPNGKIAGTWVNCWFPGNEVAAQGKGISECVAWLDKKRAADPGGFKNSKDTMVLSEDGMKVKSGWNYYGSFDFWADSMLISTTRGIALKIHPHTTRDGTDFLIIESPHHEREFEKLGIDPEAIPEDYHPGYFIYIKSESAARKR